MQKTNKIPSWIKSIPQGSHGSGPLQKKLWTLVSAYARIRDWHKYGGRVVDVPGLRLGHWSNGDGGHYKPYSRCNGIFKFDPINVHLQSSNGNAWGGADNGHAFAQELKRRYGANILKKIEKKNRDTSLKFSQTEIIDMMTDLVEKIRKLPDQPEYLSRINF